MSGIAPEMSADLRAALAQIRPPKPRVHLFVKLVCEQLARASLGMTKPLTLRATLRMTTITSHGIRT